MFGGSVLVVVDDWCCNRSSWRSTYFLSPLLLLLTKHTRLFRQRRKWTVMPGLVDTDRLEL
jgi:hypothetical protein